LLGAAEGETEAEIYTLTDPAVDELGNIDSESADTAPPAGSSADEG
jgi:hypothetical protein